MAVGKPRYGIMGGTFNPIHNGHLVTAEEARIQFNLDRVIFMPTGETPHKHDDAILAAEERFLMTVVATASNPQFAVSRLEIERPGPSYTVDTLGLLYEEYQSNIELYFITGADAVLEILAWKEPQRISGYCRFIAATRPGYSLDTAREIEVLAHEGRMPRVHMMEIPALAISSTDIRQRVREGRPIRYLMPEAVASYIYKSGFYL